ncbi:MAG: hypothetical protein IJ272_08590 [Clostridia bacterium]|nr:hypothetical protein [Clostridia bacterium]
MKKLCLLFLAIILSILCFPIDVEACDKPSLATSNTNLTLSKDGKGTLKCTLTFDDHYYNIDYNTITIIEDTYNTNDLSNVSELFIYTSKKNECTCTNIELVLKFNSISNLNSKLQAIYDCIGCDYDTHTTIKSNTFKCCFTDIDSLNFAIDSVLLFNAKLEYQTKNPLYTIQFNKTTKAYTLEDIINNSKNNNISDYNNYEIKITASNTASTINKKTPTAKPTISPTTKPQKITTTKKNLKLTPVKTVKKEEVAPTTSPNLKLDNIDNYNSPQTNHNSKLIILLSIMLVSITCATIFYIKLKKKKN